MPDKFYINRFFIIFGLAISSAPVLMSVYMYSVIDFHPISIILYLLWILSCIVAAIGFLYSFYNFVILRKPSVEIHDDRIIFRSPTTSLKSVIYLDNVKSVSKFRVIVKIDLNRKKRIIQLDPNFYHTQFLLPEKYKTAINLFMIKNRKMCRSAIATWAKQKGDIIIDEALY